MKSMSMRFAAALMTASLFLAPAAWEARSLALAEAADSAAQAAEASSFAHASVQEIDIFTPRRGIAVAAPLDKTGAVPLFKDASETSPVLMEYYSGTRLTVVGFSGSGDMVHVQCGVKDASVMGYMRVGDLRYGEYAERMVPLCANSIYLNTDVDVRSYPDAQAPVIATWNIETYGNGFSARSRSDGKWVQLLDQTVVYFYDRVPLDEGIRSGFVYLPSGAARGEFMEYTFWHVDPTESALTHDEARAQAIEHALANPALLTRFPNGLTREQVEGMNCQAFLECRGVGKGVFWSVYFEDASDSDKNFGVTMREDGSLLAIEASNG